MSSKRMIVLTVVIAVTAMVLAACGSEDSTSSANSGIAADSSPTTVTSDGSQAAANGGLDPACVDQVLGRTVTGFGDITDAERSKVFAACSAGAGVAQAGGVRAAGFDPACVATALGQDVPDITQMTPEQRTTVFQACGGVTGDARGFGGRGFGGGGGFRGANIDLACASTELGIEVTDITQLTPEQRTKVLQACPPDGIDGGPLLNFGDGTPRAGGFAGRPDISQMFDAQCVTDALGHPVTDFTTLTPDEQQTLFAACAPNFGGFGGRGQTAPGN